jgi:hypothetical protein
MDIMGYIIPLIVAIAIVAGIVALVRTDRRAADIAGPIRKGAADEQDTKIPGPLK